MAMVGPAEQGARAKNLAIRPSVCLARPPQLTAFETLLATSIPECSVWPRSEDPCNDAVRKSEKRTALDLKTPKHVNFAPTPK